jgi:mRNA interferase RelE/StbE
LAWTIEFSDAARKALKAMDRINSVRITRFLLQRVAISDDPHLLGTALQGQRYKGIWRYRVGDYRILCEIKKEIVTILVIEIGHRREIYR